MSLLTTNELLLLSKNDIPFSGAQISIHQPTIAEISLIGEEVFFTACQLINFKKNSLGEGVNLGLENLSDFEIFMSIMSSKEKREYRNSILMLLSLLFPKSQIKIMDEDIVLFDETSSTRINKLNYDEFKDIINSMFGTQSSSSTGGDYNPANSRAAKIAEKFKKRKEKIQSDNKDGKVAVFSRYVSILSVGEQKDMNELMQYTVFQLTDEFKRFQMKQSFDVYMSAKMAGAKDLDEVDNWMDDIHS